MNVRVFLLIMLYLLMVGLGILSVYGRSTVLEAERWFNELGFVGCIMVGILLIPGIGYLMKLGTGRVNMILSIMLPGIYI